MAGRLQPRPTGAPRVRSTAAGPAAAPPRRQQAAAAAARRAAAYRAQAAVALPLRRGHLLDRSIDAYDHAARLQPTPALLAGRVAALQQRLAEAARHGRFGRAARDRVLPRLVADMAALSRIGPDAARRDWLAALDLVLDDAACGADAAPTLRAAVLGGLLPTLRGHLVAAPAAPRRAALGLAATLLHRAPWAHGACLAALHAHIRDAQARQADVGALLACLRPLVRHGGGAARAALQLAAWLGREFCAEAEVLLRLVELGHLLVDPGGGRLPLARQAVAVYGSMLGNSDDPGVLQDGVALLRRAGERRPGVGLQAPLAAAAAAALLDVAVRSQQRQGDWRAAARPVAAALAALAALPEPGARAAAQAAQRRLLGRAA